jgi:hypothetical protein
MPLASRGALGTGQARVGAKGAPVPREFVGRARDLRRRLGIADAQVNAGLTQALQPLRRRLERRATLRGDLLADAERHWRETVPSFGRLVMVANRQDRRSPIIFCELRAMAGKFRFTSWPAGYEPGLILVLTLVELQFKALLTRQLNVAAVSLHALARRYQRGSDTTEAAIFSDLADLAPYARKQDAMGGTAFALPLPGGAWCGERVMVGDDLVLAVRTYLDAEPIHRA